MGQTLTVEQKKKQDIRRVVVVYHRENAGVVRAFGHPCTLLGKASHSIPSWWSRATVIETHSAGAHCRSDVCAQCSDVPWRAGSSGSGRCSWTWPGADTGVSLHKSRDGQSAGSLSPARKVGPPPSMLYGWQHAGCRVKW